MARTLDRWLGRLKWPLAVLSLLCVPGLLVGCYELALHIAALPTWVTPFAVGLVGYWVCDHLLFRRRFMGSAFSTLEHELTHAVMAWLCLRGVSGLEVTWSRGGRIRVHGGSNWLIDLGPYFFPTFSVLVVLVSRFLPSRWGGIAELVLGASLAYHLISTWRETHSKQTDLHEAGMQFSAVFLPGAYLLWNGAVVAFAFDRTWTFVSSAWRVYL